MVLLVPLYERRVGPKIGKISDLPAWDVEIAVHEDGGREEAGCQASGDGGYRGSRRHLMFADLKRGLTPRVTCGGRAWTPEVREAIRPPTG